MLHLSTDRQPAWSQRLQQLRMAGHWHSTMAQHKSHSNSLANKNASQFLGPEALAAMLLGQVEQEARGFSCLRTRLTTVTTQPSAVSKVRLHLSALLVKGSTCRAAAAANRKQQGNVRQPRAQHRSQTTTHAHISQGLAADAPQEVGLNSCCWHSAVAFRSDRP
jgi:hypothetical protein